MPTIHHHSVEGPIPIEHSFQEANGATVHVAQTGAGRSLLLHGWPKFWLTWEPVTARLADRFRLIVPDQRGFGDNEKPSGAFGADDQAHDILALLDAFELNRVGLVGHDIGGAVIQALARMAPDHVEGLFFFDFVYPGIGPRFGTPDRLRDISYMAFHETECASALIEGRACK
jgi:pimeloyl-ACP methyl ester carboxylesterase